MLAQPKLDLSMIRHQTVHVLKLAAKLSGAEFMAAALHDGTRREIRWGGAYGSLQDRYHGIVVQEGLGIAGQVMQSNQAMTFVSFGDSIDHAIAFPIAKVERLTSAAAFPIGTPERAIGVLLAGNRSPERVIAANAISRWPFVTEQLSRLYARYRPHGNPIAETSGGTLTQSPLIAFLKEQAERHNGIVTLELLDQGAASLSNYAQSLLIRLCDDLIRESMQAEAGYVHVIVERDGESASIKFVSDHAMSCERAEKLDSVEHAKHAGAKIRLVNYGDSCMMKAAFPYSSCSHTPDPEEEAIR